MRSKIVAIAAAAALLAGSTTAVIAASAKKYAPGQQMHKSLKKPSKGASSFSPGHKMQRFGTRPGHPGASGWAPGHQDDFTTGMSPRAR